MLDLVRFNLKKNNGVVFNNKINSIKKFSLSNSAAIKNEFFGYSWYLKRLKKFFYINYSVKFKKNYLELPFISGQKYKFWNRFIFEKKKIFSIIDHYKKIWPKKSKVPFHGDLTLENIIFTKKNEVFFIDWENFQKSNEWGLDLSYFFISLVTLPSLSKKKKLIDEIDLYNFKNLWETNFKNMNYNYLNNPFLYFKKKNYKNCFISKINLDMKNQILKTIK